MMQMEITLRSTILEMDTKVNVLMPEDRYQTKDTRGKKYPVLYVLHGMKEDCSSWLHLSNLFLLCRDLDLIVIMPSSNNSFYVNQVYGRDYLRYIAEELPTKLKNFLPIDDDPDQTFIMGESMGGYGALRCGLGYPEQYGKVVCLSAGNLATSINVDNRATQLSLGYDRNAAKTTDNNLYLLMERLSTFHGHIPQIKLFCGTEDFVYPSSIELSQKLQAYLPNHYAGANFSKGVHNFFYWNRILPDALRFLGFDIKENSVI